MTKYLKRITCAALAFAIGVTATWITVAVRHRSRNTPTVISNNQETQRLPVPPSRVWPQPRPLDRELIDAERLAYQKYLVKRFYKTIKVSDWHEARDRAPTSEMSYATLLHNGKVLTTFDQGLYHPMGNSTTFGLFTLLGVYTKQVIVAQSIWRGGSYWIVNLAPRVQVIYSSGDWGIGDDEIFAVDVDHDGVQEILQSVTAFYDLQDKLPISRIPLPEVIFRYDARTGKYLPANTLHKDYLLREVAASKEKISAPSKYNFDHFG